jgi:hypothetical protein
MIEKMKVQRIAARSSTGRIFNRRKRGMNLTEGISKERTRSAVLKREGKYGCCTSL